MDNNEVFLKSSLNSARTYTKQFFQSRKIPSSKLQDALAIIVTGRKWASMMSIDTPYVEGKSYHEMSLLDERHTEVSTMLNISKEQAFQYGVLVSDALYSSNSFTQTKLVNRIKENTYEKFFISLLKNGEWEASLLAKNESIFDMGFSGMEVEGNYFAQAANMLLKSPGFWGRLNTVSEELLKSTKPTVESSRRISDISEFVNFYLSFFTLQLASMDIPQLRSLEDVRNYHMNCLVKKLQDLDLSFFHDVAPGQTLFVGLYASFGAPSISLSRENKSFSSIEITQFLDKAEWERFQLRPKLERQLFWEKLCKDAFWSKKDLKNLPEQVAEYVFDKDSSYLSTTEAGALTMSYLRGLLTNLNPMDIDVLRVKLEDFIKVKLSPLTRKRDVNFLLAQYNDPKTLHGYARLGYLF